MWEAFSIVVLGLVPEKEYLELKKWIVRILKMCEDF